MVGEYGTYMGTASVSLKLRIRFSSAEGNFKIHVGKLRGQMLQMS